MANNTIQIRRTSTSLKYPNTTAGSIATNSQYIATGELALNLPDKKLFSSDGTNPAFEIGSNLTSIAVGGSAAGNLRADATQITIVGIPLSANSSLGTAGQVLTSNGSIGSPYWSSIGSGSIVSGSGTATLNFGALGSSGNNEATVTISGLTTISSTSQVRVWVASDSSTAGHHSENDHKYFTTLAGLSVSSVTAGSGFSIFARSIHKLSGNWSVKYFWQNY